jgi:hypothetical protein
MVGTSFARADNVFDLSGPKIEINVTRAGKTLGIADVPNLLPGDRLWIHVDLPDDQAVHYLLVIAFLRGSTNPPPEDWFTRAETWNKQMITEGIVVTVPKDAQQAVFPVLHDFRNSATPDRHYRKAIRHGREQNAAQQIGRAHV